MLPEHPPKRTLMPLTWLSGFFGDRSSNTYYFSGDRWVACASKQHRAGHVIPEFLLLPSMEIREFELPQRLD